MPRTKANDKSFDVPVRNRKQRRKQNLDETIQTITRRVRWRIKEDDTPTVFGSFKFWGFVREETAALAKAEPRLAYYCTRENGNAAAKLVFVAQPA